MDRFSRRRLNDRVAPSPPRLPPSLSEPIPRRPSRNGTVNGVCDSPRSHCPRSENSGCDEEERLRYVSPGNRRRLIESSESPPRQRRQLTTQWSTVVRRRHYDRFLGPLEASVSSPLRRIQPSRDTVHREHLTATNPSERHSKALLSHCERAPTAPPSTNVPETSGLFAPPRSFSNSSGPNSQPPRELLKHKQSTTRIARDAMPTMTSTATLAERASKSRLAPLMTKDTPDRTDDCFKRERPASWLQVRDDFPEEGEISGTVSSSTQYRRRKSFGGDIDAIVDDNAGQSEEQSSSLTTSSNGWIIETVSLTSECLHRLGAGGLLDDSVIEYFFRFFHLYVLPRTQSQRVFFFSSYFYSKLTGGGSTPEERHHAVHRWTNRLVTSSQRRSLRSIWEFDVVVVPLNLSGAHWTLALILFPMLALRAPPSGAQTSKCESEAIQKYPSSPSANQSQAACLSSFNEELDDSDSPTVVSPSDSATQGILPDSVRSSITGPAIFHLDSLEDTPGPPSQLKEILVTYFQQEFKSRSSSLAGCGYSIADPSEWLYYPQVPVPIQENGFDCGIFLIEYVRHLFTCPERLAMLLYNAPASADANVSRWIAENWFDQKAVTHRRRCLRLMLMYMKKHPDWASFPSHIRHLAELFNSPPLSSGRSTPRPSTPSSTRKEHPPLSEAEKKPTSLWNSGSPRNQADNKNGEPSCGTECVEALGFSQLPVNVPTKEVSLFPVQALKVESKASLPSAVKSFQQNDGLACPESSVQAQHRRRKPPISFSDGESDDEKVEIRLSWGRVKRPTTSRVP